MRKERQSGRELGERYSAAEAGRAVSPTIFDRVCIKLCGEAGPAMSRSDFVAMDDSCSAALLGLKLCFDDMGDSAMAEETVDERCRAEITVLSQCQAASMMKASVRSSREGCGAMLQDYQQCRHGQGTELVCRPLLYALLRCGVAQKFTTHLNN